MATTTLSNNHPVESFNVSAIKLEDLYRSSKLRRRNEATTLLWAAYLTSVFAQTIFATSVPSSFIAAIVFISLNMLLMHFCIKRVRSDNPDEKIIQDIFKEKGKKIVFQTNVLGFLGMAGYNTTILNIIS